MHPSEEGGVIGPSSREMLKRKPQVRENLKTLANRRWKKEGTVPQPTPSSASPGSRENSQEDHCREKRSPPPPSGVCVQL